MRNTDPTAMTPAERLDELAALLARGVQRLFAHECKSPIAAKNSQVRLDDDAGVEAACGPRVHRPQSRTP